jgi:hypothetical protein
VIVGDGSVVCRGRNLDGQCKVPADLGRAVAVSCGEDYTAAVTESKMVVCWANNTYDQCNVPIELVKVQE